jgi:GT2 family glycosyltransferase
MNAQMTPPVSVVMVTYGAWQWTERALRALLPGTAGLHEVIVVDNGSRDGTPERVVRGFPDVQLLRNTANRGFGPACNQGAEAATAQLVCFLNSDAIVQPGWLTPLAQAVAHHADVGAAVPCVHELDGRVQCAGALLGRDGSVIEYGNGAPAADAAVAFPRAVDFGPAACMVVDRTTFLAHGGFSPVYAPAYYEDADLCMTFAAEGLRTLYIPVSHVRHARYGSGDSAGARALSDRNRTRFVGRWGDALVDHPATLHPPTPQRVLAARDAVATGRILVLACDSPGAPLRVGEWLRAVREVLPWVSVTVVVERDADAGALRDQVEVLAQPVNDVLCSRRFHYDAIVAAESHSLAAAVIDEFQPQARRLPVTMRELEPALASAGLVPTPRPTGLAAFSGA